MKTNIQETNVCSKGKDVADKLSKIDKHDQLQNFKDQLQVQMTQLLLLLMLTRTVLNKIMLNSG